MTSLKETKNIRNHLKKKTPLTDDKNINDKTVNQSQEISSKKTSLNNTFPLEESKDHLISILK